MRRLAALVWLALVVPVAFAATFEVPSDSQLLERADVVVVATVTGSENRPGNDRTIFTDSRLRVEQALKGSVPSEIVVSEAGGFVNGRGMIVAGSASYEPGTRVLAFLRQRDDGTYFTAYMALGKYRFAGELLVRDAKEIEPLYGDAQEGRDAESFLNAIRTGKFDRAPKLSAEAVRKVGTNLEPPQNYVFSGGSPVRPIRWKNCETSCSIGYKVWDNHPGTANTVTATQNAVAAWSNASASIDMSIDGLASNNDWSDSPSNENKIILNYPAAGPLPGFCDASIACAIIYFGIAGDPHSFKGLDWWSIEEGHVLILNNNSLNQTALETVVGHEVGHTLSFIDTSQNALMNGSINFSRGPVLGTWDSEALSMVYGNALPPCNNVSGVSVSGGGTVTTGATATLTATASGTTPFTYQWYEGASPSTANPISGATNSSYTTPAITTTKQYWVKVSNSCPSFAASATVTVTPQSCDVPVITSDPVSQTITTGTSATLTAAGNGSMPITWRWYRANTVGDTSQQVGTNSPTFNTGALTQTTSYWVRMINDCGSDDSALATITVSASCVQPTFSAQASTINLALNQGTTISLPANGTAPITYQWYRGPASDTSQPIAGATSSTYNTGNFTQAGTYRFWVRATNCNGTKTADSPTITVNVACPSLSVPEIAVPAVAHYTAPYTVSWTGDPATSTFEVQEATDAAFTQGLKTFTVSNALQRQISAHTEVLEEKRFHYRVRAVSICTSQPTAWSATASTVIVPPLPANSTSFAISLPLGSTNTITQNLLVPGFGETANNNDTFSITIDTPWLTVFPASGALSAGGTTVQLTISPAALELGTTTATITIVRTPGSSAKTATHNGPVTSFSPFSVTMVTPVSPDGRDGNPPPGTLIIPAVAHAQGIGSPFQSDVRLVNVSFEDIDYAITFTPSQSDGTVLGKKTQVTIPAGDTVAFDDIVKNWYGAGVLGESGLGTIEIRPLNAPSPTSTFASSRTYALDAGGTLGQYIPALRLDQFVKEINQDPLGRISLQQIANSEFYRTNLGFVEGSGSPAQFRARLLSGDGSVLQTITRDLPAFGHFQTNLTSLFGNIALDDGRVEVETISSSGLVSTYASVVNNRTNDPLMVFPVQPARNTAGRYVLAGIAEFEAPDGRNFHSDMRVYNAGNAPVTVTLWYYDRGQSEPSQPPRQVTLAPGEVKSYNNVLPALWSGLVGGGSIVATAPPDSSLVLTAQTYSRQADGGTKGQFIPGVTLREAAGLGQRALEVLQLEQSAQYRSNVGVVEVTGKPAVIEITMFEPDTKTSAVVQWGLNASEYRQFDRILESFGQLGTVYNGRVSIRVIGGEGRVYAYGSTVDNRTEDPTYVPAQ